MNNRQLQDRKSFFIIGMIFICWMVLGPQAVTAVFGEETISRPEGAVLVPEKFLRKWDPVTLFFKQDRGPSGGGPEDHPENFASLSPAHPGSFRWLNAHTLQFRPVEPWPAFTRFTWTFSDRKVELYTLLSSPVKTLPGNGTKGLNPVKSIYLEFPESIPAETLSRNIQIELRPHPGTEQQRATLLTDEHFKLRAMEAREGQSNRSYTLILDHPIPGETQATLRMPLSMEGSGSGPEYQIRFSTAEPFQITSFNCSRQRLPLTVNGVTYDKEQALPCGILDRPVRIQFSSSPKNLGPVESRNLVRFSPSVKELNYSVSGNRLYISGKFQSGTLYQADLIPSTIQDVDGRPLKMEGPSRLHFYFTGKSPFLNINSTHGIMERFGPQMLPLKGRGYKQADLRIYPIDPMDRSFWPFFNRSVRVVEDTRPPGPGEEIKAHTSMSTISHFDLGRQIKQLGSPPISTLVNLPLEKRGRDASFGIDLKPFFKRLSGENESGTYLVGLRNLDQGNVRHWVRFQVTDLSLATVEEPTRTRFVVTSLNTGMPIHNADVIVEASTSKGWEKIFSGSTQINGQVNWNAPGKDKAKGNIQVRRIVVRKNKDVLVINPATAPEKFHDNYWNANNETWLQWTQQALHHRKPRKTDLCHLFTDRPVYKPEHTVHFKGYIRQNLSGQFSIPKDKISLEIYGPGNKKWKYDLPANSHGSVYYKFTDKESATGDYTANLFLGKRSCGYVSFEKTAYRLPRFRVTLNGPDVAPLDREFEVGLNATYYAGGMVVDRPVSWRVTQFPYYWNFKKQEGFVYSNDARFSGGKPFRSQPSISRSGQTDETGHATLRLNPTLEPTAQPRRYIVEGTVVGADNQTVTNTLQVVSLPAFTLGLKSPRFLEAGDRLEPKVVAIGPDGKAVAGQPVTLRFYRRQWNSILLAGDFSQGGAKYRTEEKEDLILEKKITSGAEPLSVSLPVKDAGVYVIELETHDQFGRSQNLRLDLFAGGETPVTWSRPPTKVFKVTTDKDKYAPGEDVTLILESPFQEARALAIVEEPGLENRYEWVDIQNGSGVFVFKARKQYLPRVPVHFVLMRGRLGRLPKPDMEVDLTRPTTLASTQWVEISPVENQVKIELKHPDKAQPGEEIEVAIQLSDHKGNPLSGEVTLWLVDQAVLSLGKEQRLDPLPDFLVSPRTRLSIRDTRNLTMGYFPFRENPGGASGSSAFAVGNDLLDKVTLRKNFQPMPYFNPNIQVDSQGRATVKVKLPDNLTNFKLRAKAISGLDRFGFAKGHLRIRLPVIVQPTLPRFVRPGDEFTALALGRVVEGEGGPGRASIKALGLELKSDSERQFTWDAKRPHRVEYKLRVPTPGYTQEGELTRTSAQITLGVERTADGAKDAFSVPIPLLPDRKPVTEELLVEFSKDKPLTLPEIEGTFRAGTFKRTVLLTAYPGILQMTAALDYLVDYPHGCTEQRISRARVLIGARRLEKLLLTIPKKDDLDFHIHQTLEFLKKTVNDRGLAAYWPGSKGYVSLTAWVLQFLMEAEGAGYPVDVKMKNRMIKALESALRSDYRRFAEGVSWSERVWAMSALASAGKLDRNYLSEFRGNLQYLNAESLAQTVWALKQTEPADSPIVEEMKTHLWNEITFRLYQGKKIYAGLKRNASAANAIILPSETRTLAEILRAVADSEKVERQLLIDALVKLSSEGHWGSTNANAAAFMALAEVISPASLKENEYLTRVTVGQAPEYTLNLGKATPVGKISRVSPDKINISTNADRLMARSQTTYVPIDLGFEAKSISRGLVVNRELIRVRTGDQPTEKLNLDSPGKSIEFSVGDVVEEHVEVVNPEHRNFVAVVIPLAAGMEPLNPELATAPPEATPKGTLTQSPSYSFYGDDRIAFYYDNLPKGSYHFYFRTRASIEGQYTQPGAYSEMMYQPAVYGASVGARIVVKPGPTEEKTESVSPANP